MKLNLKMWQRIGVLVLLVQLSWCLPATDKEPEAIKVKNAKAVKATLKTSGSEKDLVKVKVDKADPVSAEKLGTSNTVPIGYATPNGFPYDAPLTSGAYSAFGGQSHLYQDGRGAHIQQAHHGEQAVIQQGPHGAAHLGHQHSVAQVHQHGHEIPDYDGVIYVGRGGHQVQHLEQHHHAGIGGPGFVNPYGDGKAQAIGVGAQGLHQPFSPYGHGGVVYMGNGLVPEHIAGVKQVGPVLPPGYQQDNVVIKKQSDLVGPLGQVHHSGIAVKNGVHPVGHHHHQYIHHPEHGYFDQGLPHHLSVGRGSLYTGVDPYGNVKDVKVKERFDTEPGLGYNGYQKEAIAHTDRAILGHQFGHHRGFNPDPYFNNEPYPGYQRHGVGHATTLLTTGPNQYYKGKNPVDVYQRIHRLG